MKERESGGGAVVREWKVSPEGEGMRVKKEMVVFVAARHF